MNFFEHQERARRQTGRLVGLFALAVAGLVLGIYAVVAVIFAGAFERTGPIGAHAPSTLWHPDLFAAVTAAVGMVVGTGSLYKASQLAGGGAPLAISLGGRRIQPDSSDPLERKVLNIVEEMALASGLPVPPVFLMDAEPGINAFAAGHKSEQAVIGLTRGCAEQLSRDELQGVIAHEFSHILNGDMRLNIRLIAIVHGILVVGLIGYHLIRMAASGSRSRRDEKNGTAPLVALGLGLMAIGFIGTFIGTLIKAAVSRQREFLADASAVQFTRNPAGIAGALARIGGFTPGSRLRTERAAEASHMYFASGVASLFSTHPPLEERIRRIDRFWQAERRHPAAARTAAASVQDVAVAGFSTPVAAPRPSPGPAVAPTAAEAVATIGRLSAEQITLAGRVLANLPVHLRDAAHEPYAARAVVYAMLLDDDPEICQRQFDVLANHADPAVHRETIRLHRDIATLPRSLRLPLLEISITSLKGLSTPQYERFRENTTSLIAADRRLSLFEWSLRKTLVHSLDPVFEQVRQKLSNRRPRQSDAKIVLAAIAHAGAEEPKAISEAYGRGAAAMGLERLQMPGWNRDTFARLDTAVDALARLQPRSKARLIRGLAEAVAADGHIEPQELELLRAITAALDCPMPLLA
jgi:Zn-dependent protease with chaperone function